MLKEEERGLGKKAHTCEKKGFGIWELRGGEYLCLDAT